MFEFILTNCCELVAYLRHDDLWFPHHLSSLTAKIADGFDLVYGLTALVLADETIQAKPSSGNYFRGMWIPPSGIVHRREIVERLGNPANSSEHLNSFRLTSTTHQKSDKIKSSETSGGT